MSGVDGRFAEPEAGFDSRGDERMLLGACLRDADVAAEIVVLVQPDDLEVPENRALLRVIGTRLASGLSVDVVNLTRDLALEGRAKMVGGASYVAELPEHCPSVRVDLENLAARIRTRALVRELGSVAAALDGARKGQRVRLGGEYLPESPHEAAAAVAEYLSRVGRPSKRTEWSLGDAIDRAMIERAEARDNPGARPIPTCNPDLDEMLGGGLRQGELAIVAGRPGSGKSAWSLGYASDAAASGRRVGFISLEMRAPELADRLLSRATGMPLKLIRSGNVDDSDEIRQWRQIVGEWDLRIEARPGMTTAEVVAQARRWKARGLDLLVIDYLQRIRHEHAERQDIAVGRTSSACKEIALALEIPVVLLSQLNREVEKRATKPRRDMDPRRWWESVATPRSSDLRESGQIEQDADVIMFPMRATQFGLPDVGAAAIALEKNRNGSTGIVPTRWDGPTASYEL